jgi:hypothetical protein
LHSKELSNHWQFDKNVFKYKPLKNLQKHCQVWTLWNKINKYQVVKASSFCSLLYDDCADFRFNSEETILCC